MAAFITGLIIGFLAGAIMAVVMLAVAGGNKDSEE